MKFILIVFSILAVSCAYREESLCMYPGCQVIEKKIVRVNGACSYNMKLRTSRGIKSIYVYEYDFKQFKTGEIIKCQ